MRDIDLTCSDKKQGVDVFLFCDKFRGEEIL